MKLPKTLVASLLVLGSFAAASAEEPKVTVPGLPPAPAAASPAASAYTDQQLLEEFGWFVGKKVGAAELELNKSELDALLKGFNTAAQGKESPYELEKIGPAMDQFMQRKQTAYLSKMKEKGSAEATAFMADVKKHPGVVVLPSGLAYEIVKPGEGPAPKPTDTVKVHYVGTLVNGTEFDSSLKRGEPVEFQLDQVIPGWTEGLQKISKGGEIKLYIPPQLGYGDEGRPGIPPASTLVFDVQLLDLRPAPAAPAPGAAPAAPVPAPAPAAGGAK